MSKYIKLAAFAAILVAIWGLEIFLVGNGIIDPYWERIIFGTCVNIILAVSLNLIIGFTGLFAIGHAGFMAIGAYVSAIMTVKLAPLYFPGLPIPVTFLIGILAGALATALVGFAIGLPTLRLKGDYLAIATLGMGEIIRVLIYNIDYVGGASGLMGIPPLATWSWLYWSAIITIIVIRNFIWSSHGRACIAVRENEIAAEAMGINTTKYKVLAFTIGAFFAGVAGALFAHFNFIAHPKSFDFMKSFEILIFVVLGGMGSLSGSVLAAIFVTFINAFLADFPEVRMIVYSVILVVVMIFKPDGMLGTKELTLKTLFKGKDGDQHDVARS